MQLLTVADRPGRELSSRRHGCAIQSSPLSSSRVVIEAAPSSHMGCERATQALTCGLQSVEQRPQFVAKVRELSTKVHQALVL